VGGLFLLSKARELWVLDAMEAALIGVRDRIRVAPMVAGGALTALIGAALVVLRRWAPALLIALALHRVCRLGHASLRARQRRDDDLKPNRSTVNAAVLSLAVLGEAPVLAGAGRLG
jgi:hypothetical protein